MRYDIWHIIYCIYRHPIVILDGIGLRVDPPSMDASMDGLVSTLSLSLARSSRLVSLPRRASSILSASSS